MVRITISDERSGTRVIMGITRLQARFRRHPAPDDAGDAGPRGHARRKITHNAMKRVIWHEPLRDSTASFLLAFDGRLQPFLVASRRLPRVAVCIELLS